MATAKRRKPASTAKTVNKPVVKSPVKPNLEQTDIVDLVDSSMVRPRITGAVADSLNKYADHIGVPVAALVTIAVVDYLKTMGQDI